MSALYVQSIDIILKTCFCSLCLSRVLSLSLSLFLLFFLFHASASFCVFSMLSTSYFMWPTILCHIIRSCKFSIKPKSWETYTCKATIYLPIFISKRICVALDEHWSITILLEPQGGGWEDIHVPHNVQSHGWCHNQDTDICLEAPRAGRLYKTLWFGFALRDTHHICTYIFIIFFNYLIT